MVEEKKVEEGEGEGSGATDVQSPLSSESIYFVMRLSSLFA